MPNSRGFTGLLTTTLAVFIALACCAPVQTLSAQGDPLTQCRESLRQHIANGVAQAERHGDLLEQEFFCLVLLALIDQQQGLEEDIICDILESSGELAAADVNKAIAAALATQVADVLNAGHAAFDADVCDPSTVDNMASAVRALVQVLKDDLDELCNYDDTPGAADEFCMKVQDFVNQTVNNPGTVGAAVPGISSINPLQTACDALERITLPQTSFLGASTAIGWKNAVLARRAARAVVIQCALELLPLSVSFAPPTLLGPSFGLLGVLDALDGLPPTNPLYAPLLALCQALDAALNAQVQAYTAKLDQLEECLDLLAQLKDDLLALDVLDPFESDWVVWNDYQVAIECLTAFKMDFLASSEAAKQAYEDSVRSLADKIKSRFVYGPDPNGFSIEELRNEIRNKLLDPANGYLDPNSPDPMVNPLLCEFTEAVDAKDAVVHDIDRAGIGAISIGLPNPDDVNDDGILDKGTETREHAIALADCLYDCVCVLEPQLGPDGTPILSMGIDALIQAGGGIGPLETCADAVERGINALLLVTGGKTARECAEALCQFYSDNTDEPVTKEGAQHWQDVVNNAEDLLEAACQAVEDARGPAGVPEGKNPSKEFKEWLQEIIDREFDPTPGTGLQEKINDIINAIDTQLGDALVNKFKNRGDWMDLCGDVSDPTATGLANAEKKLCDEIDTLDSIAQDIFDNLIGPAIDRYLDLVDCKMALAGN